MIHARGLTKIYADGTWALEDINLDITSGELVYLLGESGAGKTTLLKLLLGMEKPTAGELSVLGIPLKDASTGDLRLLRRSVGVVFQDFKLIMGRTAWENVALSLRILGIPYGVNKEETLAALNAVGLTSKVHNLVETLSWGERQRVALARAMVRKPCLLLADEPTGNLDAESVNFVASALRDAKKNGATVLVVTHDFRLLKKNPGQIIMLKKGRLERNKSGTHHSLLRGREEGE